MTSQIEEITVACDEAFSSPSYGCSKYRQVRGVTARFWRHFSWVNTL